MAAPVDPPEPTTPPPAETQPGPWASDLAQYIEDENARAAADRYLREKVQPRITQLEQAAAPAEASELWTDLNADPASTLNALIETVYGSDFAQQYAALFDGGEEPETSPEPAAAATTTDAALAALSDEDREALAWAREQRVESQNKALASEYDQFKQGLKESHGLEDDDLELIDPFLYGSADNPDLAIERYQAWKQRFGTPAETPAVPTPPPVLGGPGAAASTPPPATEYTKFDQLGDALKAHLDRQKATTTPPPVIG